MKLCFITRTVFTACVQKENLKTFIESSIKTELCEHKCCQILKKKPRRKTNNFRALDGLSRLWALLEENTVNVTKREGVGSKQDYANLILLNIKLH